MVVMNRMGSRLAVVGLDIDENSDQLSHDFDCSENSDTDGIGKLGVTLENDSIVTPARLHQWDVTITKGESLPASLLPSILTKCGNSAIIKNAVKGPILTVEWIPKCRETCDIVLRLQDEGLRLSDAVFDDLGAMPYLGSGERVTERDPISLVFHGVYIPSNH